MFQQIDMKIFTILHSKDLWLISIPLCKQASDDDTTVMIEFTPTIPHCRLYHTVVWLRIH